MSINWVMLSEAEGFTPLPGEQRLYTSPPRTTLSLQSAIKYPGKEPFSLQAGGGCLHLTNRRIVYLPTTPTMQLQSFAAPLLHLHDTHVTAPWFGPNVWTATLQPVPGGGIPPHIHAVELKITFKDGGAFDFHTKFERIKERLAQAVEHARDSGAGTGTGGGRGGGGDVSGVNLDSVNLDELPAYEERGSGVRIDADAAPSAIGSPQAHTALGTAMGLAAASASGPASSTATSSPHQEVFTPPVEPPPGYEEVQRGSVADELERRLRNGELEGDDEAR